MFRPAHRFIVLPLGQNPVTNGEALMLVSSITFLCYFLPPFLLAYPPAAGAARRAEPHRAPVPAAGLITFA
jgi:hypothetical protein